MCTFMYQFINHVILDNKPSEELTISPKVFKYAPKASSKQKCMNTTREHESGALLLGYSSWRANTALCYTITRRGEWMASKLCSLSRCSSPWRADYSRWRT